MEKTKPIKRNKNIIPLSKEHHAALLFCWKIRWGIHLNTDAERIAKYVQWFWEHELRPHQEEEDKLLFTDQGDALVRKASEDHYIIRKRANEIISGEKRTNEAFLDLADFLEDHTRYEERILFPHLEKKFSEEELQHIGSVLQDDARDRTAEEDYEDEFWRKQTRTS